ncbi:MAG TPA: nitroreductase/quinone reductase family protein, partial [Solirubrobacteraceae bacterium]|nr:nitroreductase/quinone reductase family protein [Solirubrobacteraceae bacterium]
AHPDATIEVGDQTLAVHAAEATGEERERLYREQAERLPQFAEYAEKTSRTIPVVVLTPTAG